VLAAQAMGADFAYIGTAFIATDEARALDRLQGHDRRQRREGHRLLLLFTGVSGNYLAPSIAKAGMDPNNLPDGDKATDELPGRRKLQGQSLERRLGLRPGHRRVIKARMPAAQYVAQLKREYDAARAKLGLGAPALVG
jgi:nitronate monooxygenase